MPILVVGVVLLAVFFIAGRTPGGGAASLAQSMPVRGEVPTVGNSSPISPAMTGGSAYINEANRVRSNVNSPGVAPSLNSQTVAWNQEGSNFAAMDRSETPEVPPEPQATPLQTVAASFGFVGQVNAPSITDRFNLAIRKL